MSIPANFAAAHPGASLVTAWHPPRASCSYTVPARKTALIIGATALGSARAFACLEAGYDVLVLHGLAETVDDELRHRGASRELAIVACPALIEGDWGAWLDAQPALLDDIALVFIVDTLRTAHQAPRSLEAALRLRKICFSRRLPLNVADYPALCDFAVPTTQRVPLLDGTPSSLQVALTTNASACRLAARLRRMLMSALPRGAGSAVQRIAELRARMKAAEGEEMESCEEAWSALEPVNTPVEQPAPRRCTSRDRAKMRPPLLSVASAPAGVAPETPPPSPRVVASNIRGDTSLTRMRFVAQISEYWPIDQLAHLDDKDAARLFGLADGSLTSPRRPSPDDTSAETSPAAIPMSLPAAGETAGASELSRRDALTSSRHGLNLSPTQFRKRGRIYLVGSGPGSPGLLTCAARDILTKYATVVLSDKLVPAPVLALIPKTIKLVIAQKFPGNAESAQDELMRLGLEALQQGETVVRLKQGDPLLYGRGGEEILFFRKHGFESVVIPGVTSALAAPLFAGIPVTQRGVADTLALATGVGRAGAAASLPKYERPRTLVLLMSLARIDNLINSLLSAGYPAHLPCATIERASSADQRCIMATVGTIAAALSRMEQRPPGLLVVGWCVLALAGQGDMTVLDTADTQSDASRAQNWLAGRSAIITEGLPEGWQELENDALQV